MNAKLLFAATVAIALISTLAMADQAGQTASRALARAEVQQTIVTGAPRRAGQTEVEQADRARSARVPMQVLTGMASESRSDG